MNIRKAVNQDRDDIQDIYMDAFPEDEREIVSNLAIELFFEKAVPQVLSLVAETAGSVVGHIAFSPVRIDGNEAFQGFILAPLGVKPEYQGQRIGSQLIEYGMRKLSAMGVHVVFVYGDPDYYGRFGFSADAACRYTAPYTLEHPFGWQAIVLKECDTGKSPVAITCVTSLCDPRLW